MTPKEKAKELVLRYYEKSDLLYESLSFIQTKECALIAVEEIIEANPIAFDEDDNCIEKNWWKEVKQQIELL